MRTAPPHESQHPGRRRGEPRGARRLASVFAVFALGLAVGCASSDPGPEKMPEPGNAYLTIVGDSNLFLEHGQQQFLTVKFHDSAGEPLAGRVTFRVDGDDGGSDLSDTSDTTNSDGIARVELQAGEYDTTFQIEASADHAMPVAWEVTILAPQPPLPATALLGTYRVESQFDLVAGIPGPVGTAVNMFIDMTDDPNDPATFLIDEALKHITNQSVKDAVQSARPGLDGTINTFLKQHVPDIVTRILDIGNMFGQIAPKFGVISTLEVYQGPDDANPLMARHTVTGVAWVVNGVRYEYALQEIGITPVVTDPVPFSLEAGSRVLVGQHKLPLPYGKLVLFALENIVIPQIDSWSTNLQEFLVNLVNCYELSFKLAEKVGFGDPPVYEAACETGIMYLASFVESKILELDGVAGAGLDLSGSARPLDTDSDGNVDKLFGGQWMGMLDLGPWSVDLPAPDQRFFGDRTTSTPQ